ncbi:MAG: L,D-transpeptidase [Alphaproteobacteria bacterium]|nr:L,D-transpeptidase [Alphaproteobacteria bacterium]
MLALAFSALCAAQAQADPALQQIAWNNTARHGSVNDAAVASIDPAQRIAPSIEQRLRDNLSADALENFGLFIYVSKAASGPWAQRMLVFQNIGGELLPLYNWPVSTGRETIEQNARGVEMATATPAGAYQLDPKRFYEEHRSTQWNEPMPFAMFFNWKNHGVQTGLAIHAASDAEVDRLGSRASAGCVRLSPENAQTLFTLIRDNYKGMAPKFGFDKYSGTIMNNGLIEHDASGNVKMAPGYRVLVYIDEYGGESLEARAY